MKKIIKKGITYAESKEADLKVRATVESMLNDVTERGDAAVRDLSAKLDKWSPASFRLSDVQIENIVSDLPQQVIDDIKFAQTQIRNFAQKQRDALRDIEVESLPGVILGHKNIPVNSVGCYVPGGRYPMVASATYALPGPTSISTGLTVSVPNAIIAIACTPPSI